MMRVRIHYATEPGSRFTPEIDQPRTVVLEEDLDMPDDLSACDLLFDILNRHDDPDQHPALDEQGLRSMSVGDVVEFVEPGNGRFYLCDSIGWKPIEGVSNVTVRS